MQVTQLNLNTVATEISSGVNTTPDNLTKSMCRDLQVWYAVNTSCSVGGVLNKTGKCSRFKSAFTLPVSHWHTVDWATMVSYRVHCGSGAEVDVGWANLNEM